jgi:hypothetical protein
MADSGQMDIKFKTNTAWLVKFEGKTYILCRTQIQIIEASTLQIASKVQNVYTLFFK